MARTRLNVLSVPAFSIGALIVATLGMVQNAQAQAYDTASKSTSFAVFGGVTAFKPDYGPSYNKTTLSYVLGGDLTHETRSFGLSLEPRYGHLDGGVDKENYFLASVKFEKPIGPGHWLHPYAAGGVGFGKIDERTFHDNSFLTAFGGGIDFGVTQHIALKVDYEYQFWDLGSPHTSFNPNGYTAAVIYRFGGGSSFHQY